MAHEDSRADQSAEDLRHGDGHDALLGIDHNINPGAPCPETVLVARMNDDSYLLMSYPQREPAAFVTRDDAGPLRQALKAAFGSPTDEAASRNQTGNGTQGEVLWSGSIALPEQSAEPYWSDEQW